MIPAKQLICGVAAMGSVSTAAIVANQYGAFSSSAPTQTISVEGEKTNVDVSSSGDSINPPAKPSNSSLPPTLPPMGVVKTNKTKIEEWLNNDERKTWTIKIKKNGTPKEFKDSEIEENDLVGLLNYLNTNKTELLKYKNPEESQASLTLKKDKSNWDLIHDQNTINNWVGNISSEKVSFEIWEKGAKKELSSLDANGFKELLDDLEAQKNLFQENLGEATKQNKKTIIFEKYTSSHNDKTLSWTHIKTAIKDKLKTIKIEEEIKIKNESETSLESTDDDKLTGLLNHLETNKVDKEEPFEAIVFEKKSDNSWKEEWGNHGS